MGRLILGLLLGIALIFPGIELLRWLASKVLGVYPQMSLTDACLAMIILLQAIILVRGSRKTTPARFPPSLEMTGWDVGTRTGRAARVRPRRSSAAVDEGVPQDRHSSRRPSGQSSDRRRR
jgi:hypothetical protein